MKPAEDKLKAYLSNFVNLSENVYMHFRNCFALRKYGKNDFFLKAGEKQDYIGFILSGVFRYFYIDADGNEHTKHFVSDSGFVLSLSSFASKSDSLFNIQAAEDSQILAAHADEMRRLLDENEIWFRLFARLMEINYIKKEMREASFLMKDASERYLDFLNEYPQLENRVKQYHIASYLGITPESLSRIRSQMG